MKCAIAAAAILFALAPSLADGQSAQQSSNSADPAVRTLSSKTPSASISVRFWRVYKPSIPRVFFSDIWVSQPARLNCMTYADFRYDLRDSESRHVDTVDVSQLLDVPSQPMFIEVHAGPGCPYGLRSAGRFKFSLDLLYPHLPSGAYTLTVTFAPKDRSVPPTNLPTMSFEISD